MDKKQRRLNRKKQKRVNKKKVARIGEEINKKKSALLSRLRNTAKLDAPTVREIISLPLPIALELISIAMNSQSKLRRFVPKPFGNEITTLNKSFSLFLTESVTTELIFCLGLFSSYASQLNGFIKKALLFERALLKGDYLEARSYHNQLIDQFGYSLWSIETELLLGELEQGIKGNRQVLSSIQEQDTPVGVQFLASYLTQRIETDLPIPVYETSLRKSYAEVDTKEKSARELISFVSFQLNMHTFKSFDHLYAPLWYSRSYSIIDIYNTFIRVLTCLACRNTSTDLNNSITYVINVASNLVDDPKLKVLQTAIDPSVELQGDSLTDSLFQISHDYTLGRYPLVIETAKSLLTKYPECFELYEYIGRAAANTGKVLESPFSENAPATNILENVGNLNARSDSTWQSAILLFKMGHAFDSLSIGHRIVGFCFDESNYQHNLGTNNFRSLNSTRVNPWLARLDNSKCRKAILSKCEKSYPSNVAVALLRQDLNTLTDLPEIRKLKYEAMQQEIGIKIEIAIDTYLKLKSIANGQLHILQTSMAGLIRCYIKVRDYLLAGMEIVDAYLINESLLWGEIRRKIKSVVNEMRLLEPNERHSDFCWPVLLHISYDRKIETFQDYELYVAYDEELIRCKVRRPSELLTDEPTVRLLAFLRWVCIPFVMRRSYVFSSASEVDSERIILLQYLQKHDKKSKAEYSNELADLAKSSAISNAVKHVEASLIRVDTDGVQRGLGEDHEQTYMRLIRFASLEDEKLRQQFQPGGFLSDQVKVITLEDIAFRLFRELFLKIRDAFVFSKAHGLDTHLSLRIRHGKLSGRLRGRLEQLHLVTRQSGGDYAHNEYWVNKFPDTEIEKQVDNILRSFSLAVDNITDEINDSWIRVKSKQFPTGLFDYDFTEDQLGLIYANLIYDDEADYENFVKTCLNILWERTAILLDYIRGKITNDAKQLFFDQLAIADKSIKEIWGNASQSELGVNLAKARTFIQQDTDAVADWFTEPTSHLMKPFGFILLLDTVKAMIKSVHETAIFNPSYNVSVHSMLQGKWFTQFVDIFFIIFDNIVCHSKTTEFVPEVSISNTDRQISISISNTFSDEVKIEELENTIENINMLNSLQTDQLKVQSEGKSGIGKLHNIIRNNLPITTYKITAKLIDENMFSLCIELSTEELFDESK